jgi:hypothetical protein
MKYAELQGTHRKCVYIVDASVANVVQGGFKAPG